MTTSSVAKSLEVQRRKLLAVHSRVQDMRYRKINGEEAGIRAVRVLDAIERANTAMVDLIDALEAEK